MIQHTTKRFSDTTHQEGALESKSNHNWATEHCLTGKKKKKIIFTDPQTNNSLLNEKGITSLFWKINKLLKDN